MLGDCSAAPWCSGDLVLSNLPVAVGGSRPAEQLDQRVGMGGHHYFLCIGFLIECTVVFNFAIHISRVLDFDGILDERLWMNFGDDRYLMWRFTFQVHWIW